MHVDAAGGRREGPDAARGDPVAHAAELLEAEAVAPLLVPACSDVLVLLDTDQRIRFVSPAVSRVLGWRSDEVIGRELPTLVHTDERARVTDALAHSAGALDWGAAIECRMRHADTSWRAVELYSRSLEDDSNAPVRGSVATVRDVTDRVNQIVQHERLLSLVPSPVMVLEADGHFRYANAAAVETLDSGSLEDLLGLSLLDLVVPEHRASLRRALARASDGDRGADAQVRLQPSSGGPTLDMEVRLVADRWGGDRAVVGIAHDVTGWAHTQHELTRQALYDDLTGLPNRTLLQDRLAQALAHMQRSGQPPMVLFLDIDRFKTINDSLGHQAGDRLLMVVAERLSRVVRPQDTVARFGGDEFVILVEQARGPDHAMTIARRVTRALSEDIPVNGTSLPAQASIGVAVATDVDDVDPDRLIQAADTAMYRAKGRGGGMEFYTAALRRSALDRLHLEGDLRRALAEEAITVAFQPVVSLTDGRIIGAEALARWQHPSRGAVPPDIFVPAAEETGMIDDLGRQVLARTLDEGRRWRDAGLLPDGFTTAVNISAGQLADDRLLELLHDFGVSSDTGPSLQFELTEHVLMRDERTATASARRLRELGVGIAIDDFGTGYSSLAHLSDLPVDALKLDRRFVRRLGDDRSTRVAAAVAALGAALDIVVVAEGVETRADDRAVRRLGVERAQGWLYGRPMTADAFVHLLTMGGART